MSAIALLADIHGNLPALEVVVADLADRGIERVFTLGDLVSGPLWPRETAAFLMDQPWTHLAGNHERQMLTQPIEAQGLSDAFASRAITAEQREWLASLPEQRCLPDGTLLFHATPHANNTYLLETAAGGRTRLASPEEISQRLRGTTAPLMLCGHTHVPRLVRHGEALIVNPGSVGLQAYDDVVPEPHVLEVGSPEARYAVLHRKAQGWRVAFVALPYDHGAAAARARENGRPEWATALRTGFMAPPG